MTFEQLLALVILAAVVAALIHGKVRADVVALTGAAALLATGVLRPVEVQGAFASPAIITLASLFVIAYAIELSGLLDWVIQRGVILCRRIGSLGLWLAMGLCGAGSAFLNNTPIVVLAAPVVRDMAESLGHSPKRYLIPLSYLTIMGGACTLIGTSTNLLVNDMARNAGQPGFGIFEITPVALVIGAAGAAYLFLLGGRTLSRHAGDVNDNSDQDQADSGIGYVGDAELFAAHRPLDLPRAMVSAGVFVGVVIVAAMGWAPIAAAAFAGAVLLVLLGTINADEAYRGLRPEVLLLIAGMVVVGLSFEVTGLASTVTGGLIGLIQPLGPWGALFLLYGFVLLCTEVLSNAAVAVLLTPLAVALADSLGVDARPFIVAVMMAASAAFATPFGYQTNVLVFQIGRYSYMDFVRVGLPMNLITWVVGGLVIPLVFPF
ncbi:MAG: SLC13 family permease [Brevundimonas sp.]|uniref:SLC13 family permease n=1 Tax=Brevundimonas sp. TaxID=1871086 RepID=UPI00391DC73E